MTAALYAVTVLGHDRPGIIAEATDELARLGLNIEDSTMTLLRGHLLVPVPERRRSWSDAQVAAAVGAPDYLANQYPISSYRLKLRLISEGVLPLRCNKCGGTEWLGHPISLELEHRDGNSSNNELENLELLCPNCHAQTPTYRSRNRKRA